MKYIYKGMLKPLHYKKYLHYHEGMRVKYIYGSIMSSLCFKFKYTLNEMLQKIWSHWEWWNVISDWFLKNFKFEQRPTECKMIKWFQSNLFFQFFVSNHLIYSVLIFNNVRLRYQKSFLLYKIERNCGLAWSQTRDLHVRKLPLS